VLHVRILLKERTSTVRGWNSLVFGLGKKKKSNDSISFTGRRAGTTMLKPFLIFFRQAIENALLNQQAKVYVLSAEAN
jgi:hypothetical protein